ncbi:Afadin and alpha-actinin-binding-domain-containing protein [Lipomyces orientalis]|uniref:Afadin and alpha-actinin-binding-domain-containing protein n=1 Tax=Lipomyces orientalis TaxID=1233043 RepID=A0ACC3TH49_9ASCO
MDAETDLNSASRRLNAALISKGYLDQSNTLNFYEGSDARKIINFIYDIIQRRDKDATLKEKLVNTIHEQSASEIRLKKIITQLESKCDHFERQLSAVGVQRDNFSTSVKTLEVQNRNLQEDIARQKTMLQQIRAQDANERRKRDQYILRMKEKAGFEVRRTKSTSTATGKLNNSSWSSERYMSASQSVRKSFSEHPDSGSLFWEQTATIIPDVIQELTDENARLIALIRETALTLNVFTGEKSVNDEDFDSVLQYMPSSFTELSIEINNSLEALREILHEPKYVSIDEVHHREQEIDRLKKQLDSMTSNWKDAIETMNEWNQYMEGIVEMPPTRNVTHPQSVADKEETNITDSKIQQKDKEQTAHYVNPQSSWNRDMMLANSDNKARDRSNKVSVIQDKEIISKAPTRASETSALPSRIPTISKVPSVRDKDVKSPSEFATSYPWSMLSEITNKASRSNLADQQDREHCEVVTPVTVDKLALAEDETLATTAAELDAVTSPVTHRPLAASKLTSDASRIRLGAATIPQHEMSNGDNDDRNENQGEEDYYSGDHLTPAVRQIIKDAGFTPAHRGEGISRVGRTPQPRTLLQLSSPTVELSPIRISSIERSVPGQSSTLKRARENNTVGIVDLTRAAFAF